MLPDATNHQKRFVFKTEWKLEKEYVIIVHKLSDEPGKENEECRHGKHSR